MENNGNNGNNGNKAVGILQKLLRYRLKIDRKGTPIVNISSLFALACLIFAPHMSIVGVVASLLLGYHIKLDTEDEDQELEERIRKAADNVKKTAVNVTRTLQTEIQRSRNERQAAERKEPVQQQAPAVPTNQEILKDLEEHADAFTESNPAATTFHSAYTASAGSVPTLHVEETKSGESEPPVQRVQGMNS